jgi:hypothetical protein
VNDVIEREWNSEDLLGYKDTWIAVSPELLKGEYILETPLYSDIAFRGLRLSDKDISTAINFRLPTARLYVKPSHGSISLLVNLSPSCSLGLNLTSSDLRASFVLIPSSPSPIDHLKSYSSWLPDHIKLLPRRAWP